MAVVAAAFNEAYIVSDLHLGGPAGRQMFRSAAAFEKLIDYVLERARDSRRVLLVINGDFIDFLAEEGASDFNQDRAPDMVVSILTRAEFAPVLDSLRRFVKADGTQLVLTLGNHDLELALPDTRRALLNLLTKSKAGREGKIELAFDGWGYRFEVGGRRALCIHGNEADEYNFTRYDELDRVVHDMTLFGKSEFGANWRPSAGSRFVIDAINRIKARFPFIDLLKPEFPLAVTVLCVLDPRNIVFAEDAVRVRQTAARNEKNRPGSQRRMLSAAGAMSPASGSQAEVTRRDDGFTAEVIEESVEKALREGTIQQLIREPIDVEMLGMQWLSTLRLTLDRLREQAVDFTSGLVGELTQEARTAHWQALRAAVFPLVSDAPFDSGALDEADLAINAGVRADYDVVFAGHTHLKRFAKRPEGKRGFYVNTGTWAGIMALSRAQAASSGFEKIYDALRSGSLDRLENAKYIDRPCTVAQMSMDGAQVNLALGGVEGSPLQVSFNPQSSVPL